ncbi:hypothetical protein BRW65_05075 [Mycobacterium paraffinicum]|uniref:Uncharacterized protein n=1 Tax=Mycobacterium paraffinicum TaxID=53378 RepID=A0A1Q4HZW0_9MYCO|nr:hypothetical protein [Mycobacterium paraffinicum]OJZ75197.1 hypothetical protein BRW65_05075 [Mycobacterium paraffinicum]
MMVPLTGLPDTNASVDAAGHQQPAALQAEVSSTEVLITPQQVLFSTAAALAGRESIGGRLVAIMRRIFATAPHPSSPRPRYCPRRYGFLEDALMAREMERL